LGTAVRNQNSIQDEIKSRLKRWNASCLSVQNLCLPFSCKNVNINIYRNIILPVVLYGRETWSLTLREESRLRVFENRVLWRIFGRKGDEVTGGVEETDCYVWTWIGWSWLQISTGGGVW